MTRTDLTDLVAIAVLLPLSWLTPQSWWPRISRAISIVIARLGPDVTKARTETLRRITGPRQLDVSFETLRIAIMDGYMEERLQLLRDYRPGGWRPTFDIKGMGQIEEARAAGRGCVLWVCPFTYSDIATKVGLHQAGLDVTHLSAFSRGFSPNSCYLWTRSRFGMKFLSPLRTAIENRYIKERITVPLEGSLGYLRTLERRLKQGGLVSMRCGEVGQRVFDLHFMEGTISIASGPVSLARSTGAALLPVFTIPDGPGHFRISIEPPLQPSAGSSGRGRDEDVVRQYCRLLESYVLRYPHLWSGWYHMSREPAAQSEPASATG